MFEQQISFFYVRNLADTARFYGTTMGLELVRDQGDCHIYRVSQSGYVGFCERADAPETPKGIIICLVTPDVDAWFERLTAKGVTFEKTPSINPRYNIYHCFLRDPNGYLIEIQRFLD